MTNHPQTTKKPAPRQPRHQNEAVQHAWCGATWTGLSRAHCSGCGHTFAAVSYFDRHRTNKGEHGTCLDSATITDTNGNRVLFHRNGYWTGPEMTNEQKTRIRRGKPQVPVADTRPTGLFCAQLPPVCPRGPANSTPHRRERPGQKERDAPGNARHRPRGRLVRHT